MIGPLFPLRGLAVFAYGRPFARTWRPLAAGTLAHAARIVHG
jgi:hypothetical protein